MNPSRFIAFYDAMLAIIMTLVVLEFDVPDPEQLVQMLPGFACYTISFFWLGFMWISSYTAWQHLIQISPKTLFIMLISLFFCSFFPFSTTLVVENFTSRNAQIFYGLIVLCITAANTALTRSMNRDHAEPVLKSLFMVSKKGIVVDLFIKILGLILYILVWPPCMTIAIFMAVLILVINLFINSRIRCQMNCNQQRKN